jgi:aminocarboxymuconate-semialdehyde decarboxylase
MMSSLATGFDDGLTKALGRLAKSPAEYFRMLYVDTAMFRSRHAVECVVDFFGADHVLFGTDAPLDTTGGSRVITRTIEDVEHAVSDDRIQTAIFEGNARRLLGLGVA